MDADVLRSRYGLCQFTGLLAAQQLARAGLPGTVVGRYEVLTYTGLSAPFLLSSPQGRSGLAPANLLLRMAGLAALTALFLVRGAARSHDTVPGSDAARALRRSLSGGTRRRPSSVSGT